MQASQKHRFLFVGDAVLQSEPEISKVLRAQLYAAEIRSCNVEAPLRGFGAPIKKTGPLVAQDPKAADWLIAAGFNLFPMANNHIYDFGPIGMLETMEAFPQDAVLGVGEEEQAYEMLVKTFDDVNYGFLAYGENGYGAINGDRGIGHAWINHARVPADIRRFKSLVDVLIVQVHAGVELLDVPIPEWRAKYRQLIDLGADVVIAHHPHVMQGIEEYKGKLICYSLGNFYFDYPSNHPQWNTGAMLTLDFQHKQRVGYDFQVIKKDGQQLSLEEESVSALWLKNLNEKLTAESYIDYVTQAAVKDWEQHHAGYYAKAFNGVASYSLKALLKHGKRLFFNRGIDYNMLWHNQFIESNKWLVDRAIRYKFKQENPED